jgi:hypothetical protein
VATQAKQLGAPIVLVWDNLGGHTSTAMRALIASRPWLRVYALPAYAPELTPVEKVWSHLKRGLANLTAGTVTNLAKLTKTRLKKMQYTHDLVDGFFRGTGLSPPNPDLNPSKSLALCKPKGCTDRELWGYRLCPPRTRYFHTKCDDLSDSPKQQRYTRDAVMASIVEAAPASRISRTAGQPV